MTKRLEAARLEDVAVVVRRLRVFWLEDDRDAIEGEVSTLRRVGVRVRHVPNVVEASLEVDGQDYDLLCVDQRVPGSDGYLDNGGEEFVVALRGGSFGNRNRDTPFVLVTADASWIDLARVSSLDGYQGIVTKESWVSDRLLRILDRLYPGRTVQKASTAMRTTALIVDRSDEPGADLVRIFVPTWTGSELVDFPYSALPDEVQQELDSFGAPVDISCVVDIDATSVAQLGISEIERIDQVQVGDDFASFSDT